MKVLVLILATFIVFGVSRWALSGSLFKIKTSSSITTTENTNTPILPKGDFETLNSDKISFNYPKDWVRSDINGSSTVLIIRHDDDLITVRKEVGDFSKVENQEKFVIADAIYEVTNLNPKSINEFKVEKIGKNNFYSIRTGRGKGILSFNYYLPTKNAIYTFEFISKGFDWRNEKLDENTDDVYIVFKQILNSVLLKK